MNSGKFTLGELRDRILKLLSRYSSNGSVVVSGEKADIENRLVTSINIHLSKLMYEFFGKTKRQSAFFFVPAVLEELGGMSLRAGETVRKSVYGRELGFYIEARGEGTLKFDCGGKSITRQIYTDDGAYTVIKGTVGNTEDGECSVEILCGTYLDIRCFTVYGGVLEERGDTGLLCCTDNIAAYLPKDCSQLIAVYRKTDAGEFAAGHYVPENSGTVLIERRENGEYEFEYIPEAPSFREGASDSDSVEIPSLAADALCYMCAADLCPVCQPELYSRLTYKYREILENLYPRHRKNRVVNSFYGVIGKRGIFKGKVRRSGNVT